MTGKYSWIALFALLQISVVLCRSTEKPKDEEKVLHEGPIFFIHGRDSVGDSIDEYFGKNVQEPTLKSPTPKSMSSYVYIEHYDYETYNAILITSIVIGVFTIVSLILGCIMCACCKKEPRRGFIVNRSTGGLPVTTVPGIPGKVQRIQPYLHSYGTTPQQIVNPSKD